MSIENPSESFVPGKEKPKYNIDEAFAELNKIAEVLKGGGLTLADGCITMEQMKRGVEFPGMKFPIVRDGLDGIRAEFSVRRGLIITFTNGFENPDSVERKKIIKSLHDAGFGSYLRGIGTDLK